MKDTDKYILFHDFKHHWYSCLNTIKQDIPTDIFILRLKSLGKSQFDFYWGSLTPESIKAEILNQLAEQNLSAKEEYSNWIKNNKGYRTIYLSDNSNWTLRFLEKEQYIHIHPSRYSEHTLRIKANTLKSVLITIKQNTEHENFNIEKINTYRQLYLELPPIKENGDYTELIKIHNLIIKKLPLLK